LRVFGDVNGVGPAIAATSPLKWAEIATTASRAG